MKIKSTPQKLEIGKSETLKDGSDIAIWAIGPFCTEALKVAKELEEQDHVSVKVVNARFAKPIDREALIADAKTCSLIVTLEDHARTGGFGSAALEALTNFKRTRILTAYCAKLTT